MMQSVNEKHLFFSHGKTINKYWLLKHHLLFLNDFDFVRASVVLYLLADEKINIPQDMSPLPCLENQLSSLCFKSQVVLHTPAVTSYRPDHKGIKVKEPIVMVPLSHPPNHSRRREKVNNRSPVIQITFHTSSLFYFIQTSPPIALET